MQWLRIRQADAQLAPWAAVARTPVPEGGWIATIRQALGMSMAQLADRLRIHRQSVASLEEREVEGTISLDALRRAADALDCDVVYAVVPRRGALHTQVEARAGAVAARLVGRAGQSMALEAQSVAASEAAAQHEVETRRLLAELPRDLWSVSWDRQ